MPKYIKTHSNYRLSSKHQNVNGGKILERDITTVGGISPFSAGQTTIHSSGNFIITINDTTGPSRHIRKNGWVNNDTNGSIWNNNVLMNQTSDVEGSVESKIVLKNDFMDFRSFACYGSMVDLVKNSVNDILTRFPYELYTHNGNGKYTKYPIVATLDATELTYSGTTAMSRGDEVGINIYEAVNDPRKVEYIDLLEDWFEISNPGNINIHTTDIENSETTDFLKFFANDGYLNYSAYFDEISPNPNDGYAFEWKSQPNHYSVNEIEDNNLELDVKDKKYFSVTFLSECQFEQITLNGETYPCDNICVVKSGQTLYFRLSEGNLMVDTVYCPQEGDFVSDITITVHMESEDRIVNIKAYRNENLDVVYLVQKKDFFIHFRPKPSYSFYDNFIDSLNLFQKTLLGEFTKVKNVSKFEVLEDTEYGTTKSIKTFVFPTNYGDYNLGSEGIKMMEYINTLMKIGLRYDEKYSDNMYRSMTHESLKNLDWTKGFNGAESSDNENEYIQTGEKFKSVIRIMGFFFDQEKAYIDCLGNVNNINYNNRKSLSDYFITDKLANDGWIVNNISTFSLSEFDDAEVEVYEEEMTDINQRKNYYKRVFVEETNEIITPYFFSDDAHISVCEDGVYTYNYDIDSSENIKSFEGQPIIRNYKTDKEFTVPEINNEFMKRLCINSRYLLRKKGTIEGVESMLSLLGFRGKRWYDSLENDIKQRYGSNISYDYEVNEFTTFTTPLKEKWDAEHDMYRIDYLNSCKTIPYNTDEFMNGIYIPYQGLPVAYRDCEDLYLMLNGEETEDIQKAVRNSKGQPVKARRLYPYFDSKGIYDGGLYYQMKGGWANISPYSFDSTSKLINNDNLSVFKETLRDVRQTQNLEKLVEIPQVYLREGIVVYVNDLSNNLAVIDGYMYNLVPEKTSKGLEYYFSVEVKDGELWIGDYSYNGYISVSNPNGTNGIVTYYTPSLEDGSVIKIYLDEEYEDKFYIKGYESEKYYHQVQESDGLMYTRECDSSEIDAYAVYENETMPDTMVAFINGSYNEDYTNYSHYFKLTNLNYYDIIGDDGWKQLSIYDPEYLRLDPIQDELKGNNPHSGGDGYDAGYEYIESFKRLFGFALDNDYFDADNFKTVRDIYEEIESIGFTALGENMESYFNNLIADSKVHGMLDRIMEVDGCDTPCGSIKYHRQNKSKEENSKSFDVCNLPYDINTNDSKSLYYSSGYKSVISSIGAKKRAGETEILADSVTSQIMNTKVVELRFYVGYADSLYKKDIQEKIKYIQDKIIPYVEQMMPSTAIVLIHVDPVPWIFDRGGDIPKDHWHDEHYWLSNGVWPSGLSNIFLDSSNVFNEDDADNIEINEDGIKKTYRLYTFIPEETGDYKFTLNSANYKKLSLWNYEYKEKNSPSEVIESRLIKDTHYKIAIELVNGKTLDGNLVVEKVESI